MATFPDGGHVPVVHTNCCKVHCMICEGGLFLCGKCCGFEGATPSHCPGKEMSPELADMVYDGVIDYFDGKWTTTRRTWYMYPEDYLEPNTGTYGHHPLKPRQTELV